MAQLRAVRLYFDYVSPYSWLALMRAESLARETGIRWELRPVVYAALLDAHGLLGPAETAAKRRYTFRDIVRCAAREGLRLVGPPEHPFRSLAALRATCLFLEEPAAPILAARLADAAWGRGRSLVEVDVIAEVVRQAGLDASGLEQRIAAPAVKGMLRAITDAAIEQGVFGVPTFEHAGELFWGHDRIDHLSGRLSGELTGPEGAARELLDRPRGADRRGRPGPS